MLKDNYFILSMPRSGSSMLSNILVDSGLTLFSFDQSIAMNSYEHNRDGYFEDVKLTLLNDQIIRAKYGLKYSFLYPPSNYTFKVLDVGTDFKYDLTDETVTIPEDFSERVMYYTNNTWDVWGLTRMLPGKKWYKAYSKHGVSTVPSILKAIIDFKKILENTPGLLIKDPRMMFTFQEFSIVSPKIIFLRRSPKNVIESCRRHYGPYIFDVDASYKNFPYASNHFNLKAGRMSFATYQERYATFEKHIKKNSDPGSYIDVCYEEILQENSASRHRLERFFGVKLNWQKVRHE